MGAYRHFSREDRDEIAVLRAAGQAQQCADATQVDVVCPSVTPISASKGENHRSEGLGIPNPVKLDAL
jgi:hypothetical protein